METILWPISDLYYFWLHPHAPFWLTWYQGWQEWPNSRLTCYSWKQQSAGLWRIYLLWVALEGHHHTRTRITSWKKYPCCNLCSPASIRISAIKLFPGQSVFVMWTDCVVMEHTHTHRQEPELRRDTRLHSCAKPVVLTMRKSLRRQKRLYPRTWIQRPECQK